MSHFKSARTGRRTPGEVAFDRCFFPLATLVILDTAVTALRRALSSPTRPRTEAELAINSPSSAWMPWALFAVGLVVTFLWLHGFASVIRAWNDPSARVLRFSALGLLIPLAVVSLWLLRLPFF